MGGLQVSRALFLRFSAPVMTFGTARISAHEISTSHIPTRTAVEGMIAGCLGIGRDQERPAWISQLSICARQETLPELATDYQTVGVGENAAGYGRRMRQMLSGEEAVQEDLIADVGSGVHKYIIHRDTLQDADYLVSIKAGEGQDEAVVDQLFEAFLDPVFSPYLGRKANPPQFPFLIGVAESGLIATAPTIRRPDDEGQTRTVRIYEVLHAADMDGRGGIPAPVVTMKDWMKWWSERIEDGVRSGADDEANTVSA